jgi:fructose-1,6-bisphosphatase
VIFLKIKKRDQMHFIKLKNQNYYNLIYISQCLNQDIDDVILNLLKGNNSLKTLLSEREYQVLKNPEAVKNLVIRTQHIDGSGKFWVESVQNPE